MKKWLKKHKWKLMFALGIILIMPGILIQAIDTEMSEPEMMKEFTGLPFTPEFHTLREVYYMAIGDTAKPLVFFVHGAPGSYDNFKNFLKDSTLMSNARLVSVDRPGYGKSGKKQSEPSIEKQAKALLEVLKANDISKGVILVGHSYGGPIIARMAMEEPNLTDALVLVAPAIDPENEKIFFVSRKFFWAFFKWITPRPLKIANDEKMAHIAELKKMLPLWDRINMPVTFIHGEKDGLVPFENVAFGKKMLTNAPVEYVTQKKMGHLIPWQNPELIFEAIYKHLAQIKNN